jgi:hypothetical protein
MSMNTPMHRFKYTKLKKEQIGQKLKATEAGPKCASEFSDVLVGKSLKIVTKEGPILNYTFKNRNKLTISENGGANVAAGYGALNLKQMVFFSHMIPKTQRGYNIFVDLDTNLVTVFEVWLSSGRKEMIALFGDQSEIEIDNREVQRQIYFGYVEFTGQEPPEKLHHFTNRIEGKGMYWKQDTGIETLEFYASVISTNFVELTRHADDLSYCSPSEYILVNDNMFIYERTECEFSGIMTMYVVDLFTETQAGMRLGLNEKDELEYYMFRGTGKLLGHLTSLAPFDEHGETINLGMPQTQPTPKGQRIAYRPLRTFTSMTEEEVHQAAEKRTITFSGDPDSAQEQAGMMGGNTLPLSGLLIGKEFTLRYDDGPVYNYKVIDLYNLQWRNEGESQWHKETYRAFEADEKLVFFAHIHSGSRPRASVKIAMDLINGLTTCIYSKMGTKYYGNEVSYKAIFGVVEMEGLEAPRYVRHELTDELSGRGYTRSYSDNMTSMHLYTTPHSSAWTIYTGNQTLGMQWCAPAIYVKLRDGVYIFDLVEEACNGAETCIIENDKTLRASGFGFSGGQNGVTLGVIGAIARHIGTYDVKKFFGPKAKMKGA